jgi:hypothetical protein
MPLTYSINIGTPYESNRLATVVEVLSLLPDNLEKLVNPIDIRSSIYSIYENSVFKITTGLPNIEYIGIDRSDVVQKIYFGKKQLSGTDIMSSTLLNSDVDTFLFNTKSDSNLSQQFTKISLLSGNNTALYNDAPYIKSRTAIGPSYSQILQLDIINPSSGDVFVKSNMNNINNKVYLNNIAFPSALETSASALNGMILSYNSGNLIWQYNSFTAFNIGSPGVTTSIAGSSVFINGSSIELTDNRPILIPINTIQYGKTFSNMSITDVLKEIFYKYLPPSCSLSVSPSIAERGSSPTPEISWIIYKRTDDITVANLVGNIITFTTPAPITNLGSGIYTSSTPVIGYLSAGFTTTYTFNISDSGVSNNGIPTPYSASASINLVYPYFWGCTSSNVTNSYLFNSVLGSLTKKVETKSNKSVIVNSNNEYIYFAYPVGSLAQGGTYGFLSSILDENGNSVTSYTYSIYSATSPNSPPAYWSNISYVLYKIGPIIAGFPNSVSWQFNY